MTIKFNNFRKAAIIPALVFVPLLYSKTLNVSASVVPENLTKVKICHVPPGNEENAHVIVIDKSAWENGHDPHNSHDMDFIVNNDSECPKTNISPTVTITVTPQPTKSEDKDEHDNSDKDHKISICHVPPGNPENAHVITVDLSAWENGHHPHNSHDMDYVVAKDSDCYKEIQPTGSITPTPKEEDHKILICHVPPGNPENAHVIDVDKSAWENGHNPHNSHNMDYVVTSASVECPKKTSPSATPTVTPNPTATPTPSPIATPTVTGTPTNSPTPTNTPGATATPEPTSSTGTGGGGQTLGASTLPDTGSRIKFLVSGGLFLIALSQLGLYRIRKNKADK